MGGAWDSELQWDEPLLLWYFARGQLTHSVLSVETLKVCGGQGTHDWLIEFTKVPGAQLLFDITILPPQAFTVGLQKPGCTSGESATALESEFASYP